MVLEGLSWRVTCPNHANSRLLTVAKKRFLRTHKGVDLAPHLVVGLVFQVGDAEKFPQALAFESLDLFLRVSEQGPCFTAVREDGGDERPVQLELASGRNTRHQIKIKS